MAVAQIRGHQRGDVLPYPNDTETTIPAMTVLTLGGRIGVAAGDIAPGETGAAYVEGVFNLPKAEGEAIEAWADLLWTDDGCSAGAASEPVVQTDNDNEEKGGEEEKDDTPAPTVSPAAGFAIAAAAEDDAFVAVKLNA